MDVIWGLDTRTAGAIGGYLFASVAAFALLWRGSNWRFRFLAAIAGLLPLYKAIALSARYGTIAVPVTGPLDQMVEAIVAVLFLLTVLLLDLEIRNRRVLETRLRLAEAEMGWSLVGRKLGAGKRTPNPKHPEVTVRQVLGDNPGGDRKTNQPAPDASNG